MPGPAFRQPDCDGPATRRTRTVTTNHDDQRDCRHGHAGPTLSPPESSVPLAVSSSSTVTHGPSRPGPPAARPGAGPTVTRLPGPGPGPGPGVNYTQASSLSLANLKPPYDLQACNPGELKENHQPPPSRSSHGTVPTASRGPRRRRRGRHRRVPASHWQAAAACRASS
jgi:hypothetical protein